MKLRHGVIILLAVSFAFSCSPKQAKVETPATVMMAPADIKDTKTWISAYDEVIASYSVTAAKVNGGDASAMTKTDEIAKRASELDAVAETIKASLTGQEQTDFAAKMQEYKDKFKAAAAS
ncbi:MAG: hypothetical protein NT061_07170 [Spirochaetes bacterium]|nr:hypothetical protein [Spirochaetota bacterium]